MAIFHTILHPTDFDATSLEAFRVSRVLAQQLGTKIAGGKVQPVDWTFQDFSTITPTSQDAQIDGTAHFTGNRSGTLRLVLDRVATNQWQISGFNLQPQ